MKVLILAIALSLTAVTSAQEKKKAEEKRDGLVITYDKFRDRTFVRTERFDLVFKGGKKGFICSAFFAYIKEDPSPGIVLVVSPGAGTAFGSFAESIDDRKRVYFAPDADVILLVGGERHKLGRVTKDYGLTPDGDLRGSVFVQVPVEVVHALSVAEKWEMAIGSLETEVVSRYGKKLQKRLSSLEEEFKKGGAAVPTAPVTPDLLRY